MIFPVRVALYSCTKGMLEKVTMQRTQQLLDFSISKEPSWAVAQKIETDCFCRNLPITNDPVIRISRNLAKNSSQTTQMIYHEKSQF